MKSILKITGLCLNFFEFNGIVFEFNGQIRRESIDNEDESSKNGAIRHPSALYEIL